MAISLIPIDSFNRDMYNDLLRAHRELREEVASPKPADPALGSMRLQGKVERQKSALSRLNRRVRVQRLLLRELCAANPELADTLFEVVKDKYSAELGELNELQV